MKFPFKRVFPTAAVCAAVRHFFFKCVFMLFPGYFKLDLFNVGAILYYNIIFFVTRALTCKKTHESLQVVA